MRHTPHITESKYSMMILLLFLAIALNSCVALRGVRYGKPGVENFKLFPRDSVFTSRHPYQKFYNYPDLYHLDTMHVNVYLARRDITKSMTLDESMSMIDAPQACLIVRNDTILYEHYHGGWNCKSKSNIFSLTKTITAILCGVALQEGYINSLDDVVTRYIPELRKYNPSFDSLRIQHLLDMTAGLDFKENYSWNPFSQMAKLYMGRDVMKQIKRLKFKNKPGERYSYNSMTTAILGVVIERATKKPYAQYLTETLWQPLQMEQDASVTLDSRKRGHAKSYGGLTTSARDLARIGMLILHKGNWFGRQIVDTTSVERSLSKNFAGEKQWNTYSNSWYWGVHDNKFFTSKDSLKAYYRSHLPEGTEYIGLQSNDSGTRHWALLHNGGYWGQGLFGQVLYVNPRHNFVAVFLGGDHIDAYENIFDQIACREDDTRAYTYSTEYETFPQPAGGTRRMFETIYNNLRWPGNGEDCIQGRVIIRLTVDPGGNTHDYTVVKSLDPRFDREAMRVARLVKIRAGRCQSKPQPFIIPVAFRMQ